MYIPGQLMEMLIFYVRNLLMYSWPDKKHVCANIYSSIKIMRVKWLSVRVVNLRSSGCWVESQVRHCIAYLSRTLYPVLTKALAQHRERADLTEMLMT